MTSLVDQYKEMHKDFHLYEGSSLNIHKQSIKQFLEVTDSKTILDYGCGKGIQYFVEEIHLTHFGGILPSLYDPAVEQYQELPESTFDAVISTDVLEHIEEEDVDTVIAEIFSKAEKFVYLGICNSPAKSFLPDGRNSHVTMKSIDWWIEKVLPHAGCCTVLFVYGDEKSTAILQNNSIKMKK